MTDDIAEVRAWSRKIHGDGPRAFRPPARWSTAPNSRTAADTRRATSLPASDAVTRSDGYFAWLRSQPSTAARNGFGIAAAAGNVIRNRFTASTFDSPAFGNTARRNGSSSVARSHVRARSQSSFTRSASLIGPSPPYRP